VRIQKNKLKPNKEGGGRRGMEREKTGKGLFAQGN
jgi:hypothetical protein